MDCMWPIAMLVASVLSPSTVHIFPFDTQSCPIILESFHYKEDDMMMHVLPVQAVQRRGSWPAALQRSAGLTRPSPVALPSGDAAVADRAARALPVLAVLQVEVRGCSLAAGPAPPAAGCRAAGSPP